MTNRDKLGKQLTDKLRNEIGELTDTSSEYTEQYELRGTILGKSITAKITRYPEGENPETYSGKQLWSVVNRPGFCAVFFL